jgi:hypothetical protein
MSYIKDLLERAEKFNLRNSDNNYTIPSVKESNPYETIHFVDLKKINSRDPAPKFNPNLLQKTFAGSKSAFQNLINDVANSFYDKVSNANPNYKQLDNLIKFISKGTPLSLTDDTGSIVIDPTGGAGFNTKNIQFDFNIPEKRVGLNFNFPF